jgi:transposase
MTSVNLTDAQWTKIVAFLKQDPNAYVGNEAEYRCFVEGVLWISRSGAQWRLLPTKYGKWNSVYKRFVRWCDNGVWEQALGRSRGGFSCKIHVTVESLGNPLRVRLTAGQRHDSTQARALLEGFDFERLIADRGYAAADFIEYLLGLGIEAVIPPHQRAKVLREYDEWLYRERHLVECFINKIKHFRRIFSRFEKLDRSYLGFLHFVSALIWLR